MTRFADLVIIDSDALVSTDFADLYSPWSRRKFFWLSLFVIASGIQHECHKHLSSLPKYTLPTHPIFQRLTCPHYTAECVIYLSLAFWAAPDGAMVNRTILSAFVFVSVNLSITAATTKKWYENKFGKEKVASRWILIPYLY
jgi:3-oxo-5-alpha-steroid 4-dehydrogenase 3